MKAGAIGGAIISLNSVAIQSKSALDEKTAEKSTVSINYAIYVLAPLQG